jgi:hypothetical protein
MKYIFVAGAPGSKWSSVVKNIYWSPDVDHTDYSEQRTYHHDATGELQLMHLGAYWDPGMEFGDWFLHLSEHSREECEAEFDRPFSGTGVRIIKSHVFCHHIDWIRRTWPDCPVVLVDRANDACLGWWVRCGEFSITYPNYLSYYHNLRHMARMIQDQNRDLRFARQHYNYQRPSTNFKLAVELGIAPPNDTQTQDYQTNDIEVTVI